MIKDLLIQKLVLSLAILNCQASTSQFFEEVLIDTSSPLESVKIDNVGDLFQFEFWSYYIATQEPLSYPQVGEHNIYDKRKQQLLFSMKDSYTGKFIAFMYANVKTTTQIIHSLIIDPWQKETYYEPKDYEGVWIMHLVVLYYQNAIIYQTFQGDEEKWLWIDFRFSQAVEFIVGGTGIINGYELGIFRGRLSKIFFQYYYRNPLDIYEGTIYWLRLNEKQETIKLIPDTIDFNGLFSKEFEFNQFGRKFSIHGWAKYNNYDQFTQQLIVRLTLFKNYQDQVNIGDEIVKIMVSLDSSNSSNCGYDVISHHYHMPYPIYLENPRNDQISIRHELPFQNILTQWHFISFEYGLENLPTKSQFRINYFEDKILNSQTFSLGDQYHHSLFINTKYYAIFGGDYTVYDQLKGKLARFEFIMNFKENLNIQYNCDETCQTCFGPSQYHCLSCPKNSNRIYLEDYNQCSCQKDYISIDKQCYSFYDLFPSLKFGINSNLTQKSLCPFGQFYLDSVRGKLCIDCPQKNPFGLMCLDCILNPMDWYKSPNCKMDMISQQISKSEDAFTYKERSPMDYDCYSIDDSYDLFLLEGVQDYCNIQDIYVENCFQLQTKHLSKDTFVYCKQNHYFEQKCILLDIACVKVDQKFQRKCIECLSGYYLSDQQDACFLCPNSCVSCVNQNQCLICETGFGLINGECQKCGKYCKTCKYSQQHNQLICLSCIDNYKYYLSLNAQDCNINSIENCLIAFEVKEEGQQIYISFDYEFDPTLYPQVTQCAKCRDGYYFHQSKLLCIQGQMENCQEFYVEMLGDLSRNVCLYASYKRDAMIYSFTDECPKFRINCLKCVIEQLSYYIYQNEQLPKTASYSCILCKNGFYAEKKTGNCVLCPAELKCLSCFQQNKYSKDDWKNQIRSFYRAHFDKEYRQHKFIKSGTSQNDSDYEVLCAQCQDGYELHENQCIKICPVSCLECVLLNNENICVKCPKGLILRNRGLINNECVKCSDNCEICLERTQKDILSINPLFNNPDFQMFSSYCLSQTNNTFYDQELGMNLYCNTNEEEIVECINTITIKLVLICNKDEYENELQRQETELDKYLFRQTHILSDQLFSSSSFSQFENDQFYQLANQKSIKQILIRIQAQQEQECIITVVDQQQITQKFSKNIFSAIDVELEIVGSKDSNNNYNTIITFEKQLTFLNFKRVYIEGIQLKLVFFEFGLSLLKFASAFEQKIELTDIFYLQQDSRITFYILMQNASEIKFSNVEFNWIARQHYLDYFIKIEQITSIQKIRIENFRVLYGSFWNTHFFWLELKKEDFVYMRDVNVEYSIFNQAFIYQTSGELEINNFKINVCYIYSQEGLFQIQNLKWFFMDNFQFTYNTLFSGKLIKINTYSSLSNMYFADNELREESLLIYNLDIEIFYIYFGNVQFTLNRYNETSKFIKLTSKAKPNREMEFYLVYIFGNKLLNTPQEELFEIKDLGLIYLEVNSLKIEQLSIERAQGIPEIVIYKSEKLILTYTQIKQHKDSLFKGIYQQYDCFTQAITNEYYYISIRIYDVSYIEINSLIIQNAQSINYPIVEIKTSNILDQQNKFLKFSDIFFANNLILITNKVKQGSIIQITFEGNYQIEIANSKFENNILHQYDQIGLINTGLLFNINCQISTINLSNLNFKRNIVTNSSNSIIYIQAEKLIIQNSTFIQNSLFDYSLLQPYLYWGYSDNQEIYIEQIVENFPIKVLTGNGKIDCQDILIKNVIISNSTSSGLYISLEKDASLLIQNTTITNISTLFLDQNEDGGVFFIDTQSAISAIIQIENINVNDVFCRNRGGLLFILTGTGSTIIKLQKIKLNNVFSLLGSIVYVDFSAYSKQTQQIILDGILIENSFQSYLKFLDNFNIRISQLFLYQQFKRCLFEITYANLITIQNIAAFQLQYEAFVNISFASKVKIANISITNSTFQDSFISLNYMKIDSNIYILDFKVQNVKVLNQILITDKCINSQLVEDYQKQICSKDKFKNDSPLNLQYNKTQGTLSNVFCVIEQINQINKESIQSLIAIIPSKTQVQIQKLYLSNIICKICESGFINFNLNDDSKLFMEEITFKDNQCGQSSCMNVLKSVSTSRLLSKFDQSINQLQFDFKLL